MAHSCNQHSEGGGVQTSPGGATEPARHVPGHAAGGEAGVLQISGLGTCLRAET